MKRLKICGYVLSAAFLFMSGCGEEEPAKPVSGGAEEVARETGIPESPAAKEEGFPEELFKEPPAPENPWAQKLDPSSAPDEMSKLNLVTARIPDESEMTAPAYPGAVIIRQADNVRSGMGGTPGLASVELVSTDSEDQVLAFYKEQLEGWTYKKIGNTHYFAREGEVSANPRSAEVPHVKLLSLDHMMNPGGYQRLVSDAKMSIEVLFLPGNR